MKKLSLTLGTLKAASILILMRLILSILTLVFTGLVAIGARQLQGIVRSSQGLLERIAESRPEVIYTLQEITNNGIQNISRLFITSIVMIAILSLFYFLFKKAVDKVQQKKVAKKWAIIILVLSVLLLTRSDEILMTVAILGVIGSVNVMVMLEEK